MVTEQKLGLHIPVSHVTNLQNRIKLKKDTLANFIGMNEYFTYCSFINPIEPKKEGFHEKNQISLWTRFGRKTFSAASYMELIEDLNPDMFLMLADGNTHLKSSQKRNIKSFNSTKHFFEECVNLYQSSVTLKQSSMIGAIEGGFDIKLRKECSELVGKGPIFGVVIDGLDDCSSSTIDMKFDDIKLLLEASLVRTKILEI